MLSSDNGYFIMAVPSIAKFIDNFNDNFNDNFSDNFSDSFPSLPYPIEKAALPTGKRLILCYHLDLGCSASCYLMQIGLHAHKSLCHGMSSTRC